MAEVIIKSDGTRMYPVCGFERGQHKLFYWDDVYTNRAYEDNATQADIEKAQLWHEIAEYAVTSVHHGLIYMPYNLYKVAKEAIVGYDLCH